MPSLFDLLEPDGGRLEVGEVQASSRSGNAGKAASPRHFLLPESGCTHPKEDKTETDWGGTVGLRMTWTCQTCGKVRGRC